MDTGIDFSTLPVIGREQTKERLVAGLQEALDGRGRTLILRGELGTGKTHFCRHLLGEAERRGLTGVFGRAYRAEVGVPYSLFSDAFLPLLRAQPPETLEVLSRGGSAELQQLFPGLAPPSAGRKHPVGESPGELKTRILWTFVELVKGFSDREPLCILLDDLQWADPSSLEAVHFLARHLTDVRALLVLTRDELAKEAEARAVEMERSLLSQGMAEETSLPPFSRNETGLLLEKAFGIEEGAAVEFVDRLHQWTQGNPFFLEETLQSLIRSGQLYRKGGAWLGWEVRELELPPTVKDSILDGLQQLPRNAQSLAELAAILGFRAPFSILQSLSPLPEGELLENLDLLVKRRILTESMDDGEVVYDFRRTLVRETLLKNLGLARSQLLHKKIALSLEESFGEAARQHADVLAYHYLEATGEDTPSAIVNLALAGRDALQRFGNAEAARFLGAALALADKRESRGAPPVEIEGGTRQIVEDLARALSPLGRYDEAVPLWQRARELAEADGDRDEAAECRRRIGIIKSYHGDPAGAVAEYDKILSSPDRDLSPTLLARTRLRRGVALEELGKLEEARDELENVLEMAEELQDPVILAQAHRALVLLHIWTGNPDRVRAHGERAMELAKSSGTKSVEFWTYWGLAVLEGLLGNTEIMAEHVEGANRVAQELRSPVLGLRSAELAIEEAAATGKWDSGIIIGEQAIALARSLSQNTILPRVLVWTALIYLSRGEVDLAKPLVEEAWAVSGAGEEGTSNVHAEIPAYIGMGYLALAQGDTDEAIRIGRAALGIADKVGYGLWAIHRLVPLLAEAYLWKGDLEGAKEMGQRLRSGSSGIQHKLGLAWGQTCDALVTWLEGDPGTGAEMMEGAAQALEDVPMIGDAARLRRMKAGRLADVGDRKGALEELGKVHEIFLRLGAEIELEKTRGMFRELDARPPRRAPQGEGELSSRELQIARLVEERNSNKAIARALSISPRTVSTHLSNIYQKLGISSRGELADYVRAEGLTEV
ncbi:MAG: AAA family ATPase [Gemmatimonadota bacterium]|jgi:DNA-binding CsgD family transcriptional regulator/tetratricopeptide (TPR) repeat protein